MFLLIVNERRESPKKLSFLFFEFEYTIGQVVPKEKQIFPDVWSILLPVFSEEYS
jgi:hypothetical protein